MPDIRIPSENSPISPAGELLRVVGLGRYYGQRQVVRDISFSVQRGQVLGLLGPNGAGKSSIMKMISGILPASEGQVSILGMDLAHHPLATRKYIGFLPEHPPLYEDMTVDEYLRFCAALREVVAIDEAVTSAKNSCALTDMGKRLIGNLSKGYRQRLGIAQAIIHNPPLLVLDEPTVGLDPVQINEIRTLIRHLGKKHGIILSTHILTEAQQICNQVVIIHQGRMILSRPMEKKEGAGYIVRFLRPPETSDLKEKLRVDIQQLDNGSFLIRDCTDKDINDLVCLAIEQNWQLVELTPEVAALESLFLRIIQEAP